jgi:predicted ATPase
VRQELPTGTVTFLFTDVEGSTELLHELGAEAYAEALAQHRRIVRGACTAEGGVEVDTQGDAFFVAFASAPRAVAAAEAITDALAPGPIHLRIGLHTGTPLVTDEGYVGDDVHVAARVGAAGHGGQVILSQVTGELLGGNSLTDLGEHRLKDIAEAISIFQLGEEHFPPLKTISNTNLPRPASSFIGREQELEQVLARIAAGARLLTLTGPGGSGKTRLALEAAASLVPEYKAGVFWVGLAALRDPALVMETISQTLGAKDGLAEHISERELMLLLDNLEQVIEAAPELSRLLTACPNLTLLVTSRELLRVQGEVEYPVPPLAEPEAVSLFCARAQAEPSEEIAELCARLDNLPLAVELAAARAKAISPAQILARLAGRLDLLRGGRDADPRQQTLRATIEWSHDLLTPEEQALFRRVAVFASGCTLEAAEEVVDADLDTLQSLVEKSLVRFSDERYWMLETIREYAAERLEDSGEGEEHRRRHTEHFLSLAAEAEPFVRHASSRGRDDTKGAWLDRLETELDNLRAALEHLEAIGRTRDALRTAVALHSFWFENEHYEEGSQRLRHLLELDPEPTPVRGDALISACDYALVTGHQAFAVSAAEEALAIFRASNDSAAIALALRALGASLSSSERYEDALPHLEESIALFSELGDDDQFLGVGWTLAWTHEECGDRERAWDLRHEMLDRARATGNATAQMRMLGGLSINALDLGRPAPEALSLVHEHLPLALDQDRYSTGVALCRCAHVLARTGNVDAAARILVRAETLYEELGVMERWVGTMNEDTKTVIRAALDEAAFAKACEQGKSLTLDEAVELALAATAADV